MELLDECALPGTIEGIGVSPDRTCYVAVAGAEDRIFVIKLSEDTGGVVPSTTAG